MAKIPRMILKKNAYKKTRSKKERKKRGCIFLKSEGKK